jgi:hypothetical protein
VHLKVFGFSKASNVRARALFWTSSSRFRVEPGMTFGDGVQTIVPSESFWAASCFALGPHRESDDRSVHPSALATPPRPHASLPARPPGRVLVRRGESWNNNVTPRDSLGGGSGWVRAQPASGEHGRARTDGAQVHFGRAFEGLAWSLPVSEGPAIKNVHRRAFN